MKEKESPAIAKLKAKIKSQAQIIESIQYGIIIHKNQIIQYANYAACLILEATESSQLIDRSVFDFISDDFEQEKNIRERIQQISLKKQHLPYTK